MKNYVISKCNIDCLLDFNMDMIDIKVMIRNNKYLNENLYD